MINHHIQKKFIFSSDYYKTTTTAPKENKLKFYRGDFPYDRCSFQELGDILGDPVLSAVDYLDKYGQGNKQRTQ